MKTLAPFLVVGFGGFAGSVLRYALSLLGQRLSVSFPVGTFWANLLGCLVLGAVTALAARGGALSPNARLLLATGFCGGFTTMSTFTYETVRFIQDAEYFHAAGYLLLTLVGCFAFFCLGLYAVSLLTKG